MMFTLLNNKTSVIILLVSNTCIDKFKSQTIQKQPIIIQITNTNTIFIVDGVHQHEVHTSMIN